ncbi:hypothetical protein PFISCL1PPCAC_6247, partial [Pristionchus fissidentatus]
NHWLRYGLEMEEWMILMCISLLLLVSLPLTHSMVYKLVVDEVVTTGGGNYSRHEILSNSSFRVMVVPLEGDVDLYLSYSTRNVSFDLSEFDASSTTCGLDHLDIPALSPLFPRPMYIAIYGHPSYETSKYRFILVKRLPEEEDEWNEELDYEWDESPTELLERINEERGTTSNPFLSIFLSEHIWNILEILFTILLEL